MLIASLAQGGWITAWVNCSLSAAPTLVAGALRGSGQASCPWSLVPGVMLLTLPLWGSGPPATSPCAPNGASLLLLPQSQPFPVMRDRVPRLPEVLPADLQPLTLQ